MATAKKFTEDELKQISELQQKYAAATDAFGRLKVQKMLLEQQHKNLDEAELNLENEYTELQKSEQELVQTLNDKYGAGTLDINSGEFTPAETPAEANQPSSAPNS